MEAPRGVDCGPPFLGFESVALLALLANPNRLDPTRSMGSFGSGAGSLMAQGDFGSRAGGVQDAGPGSR